MVYSSFSELLPFYPALINATHSTYRGGSSGQVNRWSHGVLSSPIRWRWPLGGLVQDFSTPSSVPTPQGREHSSANHRCHFAKRESGRDETGRTSVDRGPLMWGATSGWHQTWIRLGSRLGRRSPTFGGRNEVDP